MQKTIKIILAFALILRLLLSATTFHSDLTPFYFAGSVIARGHVTDFYDYLYNIPEDSDERRTYPPYLFNYPPSVYFSVGPVSYLLALPFGTKFTTDFVTDFGSTLGDFRLNLMLVLLKLPFLPFDLLIGLLLYKMFNSPRDKLIALTLWLFNPINLYATYMMGQFDIIPTFFVVLSIFILTRQKVISTKTLLLSALALGFGASFKIFPLMFLVPLALLSTKWSDRLKVIAVGVGTYIATILPFIMSHGYRTSALLANQTMKSFYAKIDISGGEAIILFPLFLLFLYLIFCYGKNTVQYLWQKYFAVLIIFFIFTHTHPQWFLWLTPFLIFDLVKTGLRHWLVVTLGLVSFTALLTFFDPGLTTRIFAPISPPLNTLPGVWEMFNLKPDETFMRSIFQTLFVATGLYYIYYYFPRHEN